MNDYQMEYYHSKGLMPDWAYYQQNSNSGYRNYVEQTQKYKDKAFKKQRIEELKKQLEEQLLEALMFSLEESSSEISDDIANDIVNKINATFEGGSIHPERFTSMSFSKQLALMLGKALGQAPFKLLDEILDED